MKTITAIDAKMRFSLDTVAKGEKIRSRRTGCLRRVDACGRRWNEAVP